MRMAALRALGAVLIAGSLLVLALVIRASSNQGTIVERTWTAVPTATMGH